MCSLKRERDEDSESIFDQPPTERRMTLQEILNTPHEIVRREITVKTPPRPLITWDPITEGPPSTNTPLDLLQPQERAHVKMFPAFTDARTYFGELEGMVDLTVLQGFGWHLMEDAEQLDPRHTTYHLWRDVWHLIVATQGEEHLLAYWVMCASVPEE